MGLVLGGYGEGYDSLRFSVSADDDAFSISANLGASKESGTG